MKPVHRIDNPPGDPRVGDTFLAGRANSRRTRLWHLLTGRARMWEVLCTNYRGTVGCDRRPLTRDEWWQELGRCLTRRHGKDFFE